MNNAQSVKEALKDFKKEGELPADFIEMFKPILPEEFIYVWEEYGLGSFLDGYLRVIDPCAFAQLAEEVVAWGKQCVPLMVTALGDMLVWDADVQCLEMIFCRYGIYKLWEGELFQHLCGGDFFRLLCDKDLTESELEPINYKKTVALQGVPDFDECFGYVPLLALGGGETPEHLKRCKVREHIYLISQMAGRIEE